MKSFVKLARPAFRLDPGEKTTLEGVTVALERRKTGHVSLPDGSWDVFRDRVLVSCKGQRKAVMTIEIENAPSPSVDIVDTATSWMVLWYHASWGIEGDIGRRTDVAVIDRDTCNVVRP